MSQKRKVFIIDSDEYRVKDKIIPALEEAGMEYEVMLDPDKDFQAFQNQYGNVLNHPNDWVMLTASRPYDVEGYGFLAAAAREGLPAVMCTQETGHGGTFQGARNANPNAGFYSFGDYGSKNPFNAQQLLAAIQDAIDHTPTVSTSTPRVATDAQEKGEAR